LSTHDSKRPFRLYLITDGTLMPNLEEACEAALAGGVRAIQLREKDLPVRELLSLAKGLRKLTAGFGARLFINDRVDVALASGADGVHLGVNSIPPGAVRKIAGEKLMIGASTHNIEEARRAERSGADFITFGPVYETPSKMKYGNPVGIKKLSEAARELSIPIFALGGIKRDNMEEALGAGAYGIALISGIFGQKNIKAQAEKFMRMLK